jgi:anti-sigma B factor antagonist
MAVPRPAATEPPALAADRLVYRNGPDPRVGDTSRSVGAVPDADGVTVRVVGELGHANAGEMGRRLRRLADQGQRRIRLDVDGITAVDAAALGALAWLHVDLLEQGGALTLAECLPLFGDRSRRQAGPRSFRSKGHQVESGTPALGASRRAIASMTPSDPQRSSCTGSRAPLEPDRLTVLVDGDAGYRVVRLRGNLDIASAPCLRYQLRRLAEDGAHEVRVELGELKFIDGRGLATLVGGMKRRRHHGGDLVLASPMPSTRRLLDITGLAAVFRVVG